MFRTLIAAAVGLVSSATLLSATTFTDRDAFLLATGDATNHTAPSIARSNRAPATYANGLTVSSLNSANFASATSFGASENGITGAILISGVENLNFDFSAVRFGFGLNVFEPTTPGSNINACNTSVCVESTFTFTFKNGGSTVGTETFQPVNDQVTFFGVLLGSAFDRIEMRETIAGTNQSPANDNEFFGGFVSTNAPTPVPLPAPALLLIGGLAGLGLMRRKS